MRAKYIICFCFLLMIGVQAKAERDFSSTQLKKAWKLEQIYLDSISGPIDSVYAKFRLVLTDESVCFLNDGKRQFKLKWSFDGSQILILADNKVEPVLVYELVYVDEVNMIVKLDLAAKNLAIKLIEYRLIPDLNYVYPLNPQ